MSVRPAFGVDGLAVQVLAGLVVNLNAIDRARIIALAVVVEALPRRAGDLADRLTVFYRCRIHRVLVRAPTQKACDQQQRSAF